MDNLYNGNAKTVDRQKDIYSMRELLGVFPLTAILGPRQVGKTTIAKEFKPDHISFLSKRDSEIFFYSAHTVTEVDLFWQDQGRKFGAEFKLSDAPKRTKSMQSAISDLELNKLWVIYPGKKFYPISDQIDVLPLTQLARIKN